MPSKVDYPNLTSAGVPVPDFQSQTPEQVAEYSWRMKVYEEEIMPREYPKIIWKQ